MSRSTDLFFARAVTVRDPLPAPYGGTLVQAYLPASDRAQYRSYADSLPRIPLTRERLLLLEMLASGALSPVTGFMTRDAYEHVLHQGRLPDGRPWGLPVTLPVSRAAALTIRSGSDMALSFDNEIVGILRAEEIFHWSADVEAEALGQPAPTLRASAAEHERFPYLVGGPVFVFANRRSQVFDARHRWPLETRGELTGQGARRFAVPHLLFPWRRTHEYALKCALEASDGLLVHYPDVTDPIDAALSAQRDASRALLADYFPAQSLLENPAPLAYLHPNPRAALMHAIVAQNYGASMFCLPDTTANDATTRLLAEAQPYGLTLQIMQLPPVFHCDACGGMATGKSCPHPSDRHLDVSNAELSERLQQGEALPEFIARTDIARSLARAWAEHRPPAAAPTPGHRNLFPHPSSVSPELRQSLIGHRGAVLWMTGLSGSGKSTIAHRLERDLLLSGHRVFVLDGDTLRHGLNRDLGFSEADRRENLRRAAEVARVLLESGQIVIASFISPFRAERAMARDILGAAFHEVHVDASLDTCEQRDPKGLYKRARAGEIPQFTGLTSPYEAPERCELRLDTHQLSADDCARMLRDYLLRAGILRTTRPGVLTAIANDPARRHNPLQ